MTRPEEVFPQAASLVDRYPGVRPRFRASGLCSSELFGQGALEPFPHVMRQRQGLGVAVNLDGLARGVDHDFAVLAARQVLGEFLRQVGRQFPIQELAEASNYLLADHDLILS